MLKRFNGSMKQLKGVVRAAGLEGRWQKQPNGVRMFRGVDGANTHWSKTKGTLWFDSKAVAKERLIRRLANHVLGAASLHQASQDADNSAATRLPACISRSQP